MIDILLLIFLIIIFVMSIILLVTIIIIILAGWYVKQYGVKVFPDFRMGIQEGIKSEKDGDENDE